VIEGNEIGKGSADIDRYHIRHSTLLPHGV
jgi:hypothetical protein